MKGVLPGILKRILPRALVRWVKDRPAYQLFQMRHSPLGASFPSDMTFPAGTVDVRRDFSPMAPRGRTAIFATFSPDGRISDAVVHYLKGLAQVADNIVVVGDSPILPEEADKISRLVRHCEFVRHGEYDFGSYKRGWRFVRDRLGAAACGEVVLCNDSCYGPVVPFQGMFGRMRDVPCDFWGVCECDFFKRHLQSYFLVLRETVVQSGCVDDFLTRVRRERSVMDVILKYEIGFSQMLFANGFVGEACFPDAADASPGENPTLHPVALVEHGCPLVKVKALRDSECNADGISRTMECLKRHNPELAEMIARGM